MHQLLPKLFLSFPAILIFFACSGQIDSGSYFTSFDKVRIYYEIKGSGDPVLLIHGFTNKGSDWKKKPLYDSLVVAGFKVITVDLRGNGLSGKPHYPEAYTNDAEAKDIMGLVQHLGIKKYKAIGYSRGAIILARLLVKDKRLTQGVIGGMGADFTNPLWPRRIAIYQALISDTAQGYEGLKKRIDTEKLDRLALAYQQNGQPSTSARELSNLRQKILIICGDEDEDNGSAQDLHRLIPRSQFVAVPGNHNTTWGTGAFAREILSFLNQ